MAAARNGHGHYLRASGWARYDSENLVAVEEVAE
jgi:hypothetical protein